MLISNQPFFMQFLAISSGKNSDIDNNKIEIFFVIKIVHLVSQIFFKNSARKL